MSKVVPVKLDCCEHPLATRVYNTFLDGCIGEQYMVIKCRILHWFAVVGHQEGIEKSEFTVFVNHT